MLTPAAATGRARVDALALTLAPLASMLLAFNLPPSPTLLNQCLAAGVWGLSIAGLARSTGPVRARDMWCLHMMGLTLAIGLLWTMGPGALPLSIGLGTMTVLACAIAVATFAYSMGMGRDALSAMAAFHWGLLLTGVFSAAIGFVQVFAPEWTGSDWIARSGLPGRAVGNLRQPNHLGTLLLWALIAAVGLFELRRLRPFVALASALLLLFVLVLTGSRTGLLGALMLMAWGLLDRRLSRQARAALMAAPLVFGAVWFGLSGWAHATGHMFGAEGRLSLGTGGDISSSRFAIWSNTLAMLCREPLTGVGFGEFNLAWTLSEFPDRPTAFFDHTHNLPLQLLVELGVPLGSLALCLLALALYQAWRRSWACRQELGIVKRTAFMLVLMIGLHSLLEYPLWYAYFLLPAAFAWGCALSRAGQAEADPTPAIALRRARFLWVATGTTMALGAAAAALDYRQVVAIYEPPEGATALEERVVRGQHSLLYGHHADYAAATAFGEPKAPLPAAQELAFRRAPHQLLDVRLMIAWAQALAAQGHLDKARWLAARAREFRNPGADEFFAPCRLTPPPADAFQCQLPQRVMHWRDFSHD